MTSDLSPLRKAVTGRPTTYLSLPEHLLPAPHPSLTFDRMESASCSSSLTPCCITPSEVRRTLLWLCLGPLGHPRLMANSDVGTDRKAVVLQPPSRFHA